MPTGRIGKGTVMHITTGYTVEQEEEYRAYSAAFVDWLEAKWTAEKLGIPFNGIKPETPAGYYEYCLAHLKDLKMELKKGRSDDNN